MRKFNRPLLKNPLSLLCFTTLTLSMACLQGDIVSNAPPLPVLKNGEWETVKLKWDKPETGGSNAGVPVGNGYFGAKLKGGIERESMDLNDLTFWSKGPSDNQDPKRQEALAETRKSLIAGDMKTADAAAKKMWGSGYTADYTPIGTLTMTFDHGNTATAYRRELDLDRSVVTISYTIGGVDYTRETFASFPDRVMAMRVTSSVPGKLSFTTSLEYPKPMEGHGASVSTEGNNVLVMVGKAPSSSGWDPVKGMNSQARIGIVLKGGKLTAADKKLRVEGADSAILYYICATSFNGFDKEPGADGVDPTPITKKLLSAAAVKGYDKLLADHIKDYQSLSRRLWVELNGEKPSAYAVGLQYARYDMISSSRTGQAPHNLQGMWNSGWNPTNQGSYFLNENVEKYYSLIEPANLADTGVPLWNFIENMATRGARTAKIDWGFKGWVMTHCTDIWADAVIKGGHNCFSMWPMGGTWVCQNMWEHYAFSLDKDFLKRAYPTLKGQAEFVLDLLVEDGNGHLTPCPSSSPEQAFFVSGDKTRYGASMGTACDITLARQLFMNVIKASEILNLDPDFRQKLQKTLTLLPPLKITKEGTIQEWTEDFIIPEETSHRHASHLVGAWPMAIITKRGTPELFEAAKASLAARGRGGYHPDKGAMWARLGEGDRALKADEAFTTGNGLTGRWNPKYSAFCELLVQSHTGEIELFPALPTSWKSGKIEGIRARGGYELSLEWDKGDLVKCRIDSRFGTKPPIRYKGELVNPATDSRITLNLLKSEN